MDILTCNGRSFSVIKLLGKGKGGYSYLVTDGTGSYVIKQIHHEPCDYYTFGDKMEAELGSYGWLNSIGIPMPKLLDADRERETILKEYVDGDTVAQLVLEDRMEQSYFDQIRDMCQKLYAANTNIDYYPTNFIVENGVLYYIDYECNGYMEQWDFEHWGSLYWRKSAEFLSAFCK